MSLDKFQQHFQKMPGPSFYYDLDQFEKRLQSLNSPEIKTWYAMKANPLSSFVELANQNHWGLDCASLGEVNHCLNHGVSPENILITGPAKSYEYFKTLIEKGISTFVIESENQLKWLADLKPEANVLIRFQKNDWKYQGFNVLGGSKHTQFGLSLEDWKEINPSQYNLNFLGFHIFQWGNILDKDQLIDVWDEIFSQVNLWEKELNIKTKVLDLGGGLGIPYEGEKELHPDFIKESLAYLKQKHNIPEVWLELGRYLSGPVGNYLVNIIDIKRSSGVDMIILEGGINHLVRPVFANQSFPCRDLNNNETQKYKVYGPLCTSLDYLGEFQLSKDLKPGDSLAFEMVGAYGFTESMPYFLCHDLPAEVVYQNNEFTVKRENLGPESWMR